jgi:cold shock CspA family protein
MMEKRTRETGTVKVWFADRGFGFAKSDRPGFDDVFIHVSDLPVDVPSLTADEKISWVRGMASGGREKGMHVELVEDK